MTDSRIYIADQRGFVDFFDQIWRYSTLNYQNYHTPYREPIEKLLHINEWGGKKRGEVKIEGTAQTFEVLLPLVSDLQVRIEGTLFSVKVGELMVIPIKDAKVVNILSDESFVFHQFVIAGDVSEEKIQKFSLPIIDPRHKNEMTVVTDSSILPFEIHMGAFFTKEENVLQLDLKHVFVYVLEGSFEVEQRLLFANDGLAMTAIESLDIECLSATGIIMTLNF